MQPQTDPESERASNLLRTALGLSFVILGFSVGVRTWVFTRSEEGLLFGTWTWALAIPVFCGALAILWSGLVLYRSTDLPRGETPISVARVFLWLGTGLLVCFSVVVAAFLWPAHEVTDDEMLVATLSTDAVIETSNVMPAKRRRVLA